MQFLYENDEAKIFIRQDVNTPELAGTLVKTYAVFASTLPSNQTVHVYVKDDVSIPFETMFQIYVGVRSTKNIHAGVNHLIIHISNEFGVKCCNRLFSIIQPSIKVTLETCKVF